MGIIDHGVKEQHNGLNEIDGSGKYSSGMLEYLLHLDGMLDEAPLYDAEAEREREEDEEDCLDILKARILSEPKTLAIFLSGRKNCLLSGVWRLCSLRYSARLASFLPTMSAKSELSFKGLVSPDPLGILTSFFDIYFWKNLKWTEWFGC